MSILYNAILSAASGCIKRMGRGVEPEERTKMQRFAAGQRDSKQAIDGLKIDRSKPVIWLHAASLGEYAIARPIIAELRRRMDCQVVMTFFSPTGYEALKESHIGIDVLLYLPLDTRGNVKRFLDAVKPDTALFMVSEYWYNYLRELRRRGIPTFLVSAKITERSVFKRWYGFLHRSVLSAYRVIFVLDEDSKCNLESAGAKRVTVSGNPLFDNAVSRAAEPWRDEVIEAFADGAKVFVAGSVHDEHDIEMVAELVKRHPDVKFIIVPHEIKPEFIGRIVSALGDCPTSIYSCGADPEARALIVNVIGKLAYIYRYGQWAYIGGGFTPLLHSIIEATVYGLPAAFGPRIERKVTPQQLIELGIGCKVENPDELDSWFATVKDDPERLAKMAAKAREYVKRNADSTRLIADAVVDAIKPSQP